MATWTRRAALGAMGVGAVGIGWWAGRAREARPGLPDLDAKMAALVSTPTDQALELAASWLRGGASVDEVLSAAFHAPLVYHCDESDVHAVLVQPAVAQLGSATAALWSTRFAVEWLLSPTLDAPPLPAPDRSFADALAAGDAAAAQAALLVADDAEALLVEHATRSLADPHRSIFVAQALRGLDRFGGAHREAVHRSLARHLARPGADVDGFARARALAPSVAPGDGRPDAAAWLLARLRDGSEGLADELAGRLPSLGTGTTRAAMLALAAELAAGDGVSGMGVHAVTLCDALFELAARRPQHAGLLLLRGAERLAALHERATARPGFESRPPADPMSLVADARERAVTHAVDVHQLKFAAAVAKLTPRVLPEWRGRWAAALREAPLFTVDAEWEGLEEARALLRRPA